MPSRPGQAGLQRRFQRLACIHHNRQVFVVDSDLLGRVLRQVVDRAGRMTDKRRPEDHIHGVFLELRSNRFDVVNPEPRQERRARDSC